MLNELAQLAFYVLLVTTMLTIAGGDISSVAGWIMVAVAVVCLAGLALIFVRDLRTRSVVARFLHEADIEARHRRWPWLCIMTTPFYRRRSDVEHIADLSYGPGGHFATGHKDSQSLPLIYHLASQGWVYISSNYRLQPDFGFLDHLSDAKRVIARARESGPRYGGDPGQAGGLRQLGRRAPDSAVRPDPQRPAFPAGLRAGRHRRDRCGLPRQLSRRRRHVAGGSRPHPGTTCAPTLHRSSSCTARSTRGCRSPTSVPSPNASARSPTTPSTIWSSPPASTPSTSSTPPRFEAVIDAVEAFGAGELRSAR